MPTLYARFTTLQLSVADLTNATSRNPLQKQCLETTNSIQNISKEFSKSSKDATLTEDPIYAEDSASHMRFLGANQDMPFYMVHAGKNFFDVSSTERRNRRSARIPLPASTVELVTNEGSRVQVINQSKENQKTSSQSGPYRSRSFSPDRHYIPPFQPHALCLSIFLSNASFLRSTDHYTKKVTSNDIKIDVYFNGTFCSSTYVPGRYSNEERYAMSEQIVRISGQRMARMLEKPWIIIPPGQNADGSLREHKRGKAAYAGANERWKAISEALLAEADHFSRNKLGERPVVSQYLESLAGLAMPAEVENMQRAGSPKFGIIDVVLTSGKGSKDGPVHQYVTKPTRIRIEGFQSKEKVQSKVRVPRQHTEELEGSTNPPPTTPSNITADTGRCPSVHPKADSQATPTTNKRSLSSPPNYATTPHPQKKHRSFYPLSSLHTLSEQIATIEEASEQIAAIEATNNTPTSTPLTRLTRSSTLPTETPLPIRSRESSLLSSPPSAASPESSRLVVLHYRTPTAQTPQKELHTSSRKIGDHAILRPPISSASNKARTVLTPAAKGEARPLSDAVALADEAFVPGVLSEDCRIGYAPQGAVRDVGAQRGGWFREEGVLMGARFVVG